MGQEQLATIVTNIITDLGISYRNPFHLPEIIHLYTKPYIGPINALIIIHDTHINVINDDSNDAINTNDPQLLARITQWLNDQHPSSTSSKNIKNSPNRHTLPKPSKTTSQTKTSLSRN